MVTAGREWEGHGEGSGCVAGAPGGVRVLAGKEVPAEAGLEHWRSQGKPEGGAGRCAHLPSASGAGEQEPVRRDVAVSAVLVFPPQVDPSSGLPLAL